jgi:hypothetical protein
MVSTKEQTSKKAARKWAEVLWNSVSKYMEKPGHVSAEQLPTKHMIQEFCEDLANTLLTKERFCIACTDGPDLIFYGLKWFKELRRFFPKKVYMLIYWNTGKVTMENSGSAPSSR